MRKITKAIRKNLFWVVLPVVITGIVCLMQVFPVRHIATDSMNPTMPQGTVFIVIPTDHVVKGDVISFRDNEGSVVTHRVYAVKNDGTIITKGDANFSVDQSAAPLRMNKVIGKVLFNQGISWVMLIAWIAVASVLLLMVSLLFKVAKHDDGVEKEEKVEELSLSQ